MSTCREQFLDWTGCFAVVFGLAGFLAGGCPTELEGAGLTGATPGLPSGGGGTEGSGAVSAGTSGTLTVSVVEGAANTYYDIYRRVTDASVETYESAGEAVSLPAGVYYLTQYFNGSFVWADEVTITAGATTTVELGAIELVSVENASDGYFDIYSSDGGEKYASYNASDALITAPAGTFTLKEYYNGDFTYASDVVVEAGATTTVRMGGIKLIAVEGAVEATYGIYDATGSTCYASYNDPDVIITAPAGTFTLKEYFNADFTYASNVEVEPGSVTEVEMGAIRYGGSQSYDIYVGGALVSSNNDPDTIVTAPAGTYELRKYFDDEVVLATGVVVEAGAVTEVR